ncbi:GIY-YIG nuclease family protein [Ignavibacterium sp.]|uniref:GIY-YIG nuclease family protein n=1 Tax=Ignavibacterium sp. TaxID=2651167 RepID=UPI00220D50FA|nr:GIY-YIG nuclease family protein [Ignavibacterium sp.]BDQ03028.1 MAG: hypothetical protein KatS3mg037_1603 [Ignavibacterium sp.]
MKYHIYILKSLAFDKTYIGYTNDLKRRLNEHNSGKSTYTSKFKPWKIIYYEECLDELEARRKEKYYKSAAGRRKIKKILNENCPGSSAGYLHDLAQSQSYSLYNQVGQGGEQQFPKL